MKGQWVLREGVVGLRLLHVFLLGAGARWPGNEFCSRGMCETLNHPERNHPCIHLQRTEGWEQPADGGVNARGK